MLKVDLALLDRERRVRVQGDIPPEAPLWEGTDLSFGTPLSVDLEAQLTGSGEVVVRGKVSGQLEQECRRCLDPVRTELEQDLTLVFVPTDLLGEETDDTRPIPHGALELELGEAVREELVLSVDPYALCQPDCKGLCPRCGVNLNEGTCHCVREERDPRWEVLRSMKVD